MSHDNEQQQHELHMVQLLVTDHNGFLNIEKQQIGSLQTISHLFSSFRNF